MKSKNMAVRIMRHSWWIDFRHAGVRYRMRSPENTRAGANAYEALVKRKLVNGEPLTPDPKPERATFVDFAKEWFVTHVTNNNKPSEQRTKETLLRLHLVPFFGHMPLDDISALEIERYKASKKGHLSAKSVNNHLICLGKCLRTAVEWGKLGAAPRVRLLRVTPPSIDFLSPAETARLLADAGEPVWNEMARTAVRTGMRRGELMALDWSDIDLKTASVTVRRSLVDGVIGTPKNHRQRTLPLTDDVVRMFESRRPRARSGLVFLRPDGRRLDKSVAGGAIRRICRRVGLRTIGWHTLRHTFASTLVVEGVPLPIVSALLGHSDISITMRYAHLAPSTLRESVLVLERAERRALAEVGQRAGNAEASGAPRPPSPEVAGPNSWLTQNKSASGLETTSWCDGWGLNPKNT